MEAQPSADATEVSCYGGGRLIDDRVVDAEATPSYPRKIDRYEVEEAPALTNDGIDGRSQLEGEFSDVASNDCRLGRRSNEQLDWQ